MFVECRLFQRHMQCNCADEHLPQVRTRMRQGWGAGEGTPTSLALRWEAWLHQVTLFWLKLKLLLFAVSDTVSQCQRRGDWASAVAFVLLLGFDAAAAHYIAAVRCCISAGCVIEAMPLVQVCLCLLRFVLCN
jgi:hypothetical protein